VSAPDLRRAADKVARLCGEQRDLASLWAATTEVLADAVPHHWSPCYYTLDPASLLVTSHFHEGLDHVPAEWLASEYYDDDVHKMVDVARSPSGVSTLHEATGDDPSSSRRWHRNMTLGGDQELLARLRTRAGDVWGILALYRAPGEPSFSQAEKAFVASIASSLADGARSALLLGQARDPDLPDAPSLVVVDSSWSIESATPGAERWLDELPDGDRSTGRLPTAMTTVAARALRLAQHPEPGELAVARVQTRTGSWVVLHGSIMGAADEPRVALIVEPATPSRLGSLLMSAYGLTDREKDVTRLVLQGASTAQMAAELFVSANTVQQHLKSIFEKTGVRSRRDLVGRVFFSHFEPRLRDNEERVLGEQPMRGGPWTGPAASPRRR
jgi:DNA-binding CsgD family transcriptional regulator